MTFIPSGIFNTYYNVVDELIDNNFIGKSCTIYYPPVSVSCDNCTTAHFGGISKNVYRSGGPAPFNRGSCPLCGGNGTKESETTATLRLRIYWSKKDWVKQGNIQVPEADVMIMGYSTDLSKILNMNYIKLINEQTLLDGNYTLEGTPFYHGFGHNRYFVAYLKQS